jgi:hypothetical protein
VVARCIDYKRRVTHWPPVVVNTVEEMEQ